MEREPEAAAAAILSRAPCELGEGPTYDAATDTAYWFDILGRKLFEHRMSDGRQRAIDLPFMASALAIVDSRRQLLLAEDGLYIRDTDTDSFTLRVSLEADNPATRSNDARVHRSGAFWISTMGREAEKQVGAVYWYRKGQVRPLFSGMTIPNAIAFAPDGGTGYFADSDIGVLMRVDLDPGTGLPVGEPRIFAGRHGEGAPDGAAVDADGLLWNARWGAGEVRAYNPEGMLVKSVAVPARQVSCPAFVGRHGERMMVTSAWKEMSEAERRQEPNAGHTFLLPGRFNGRLEPRVSL